MPQEDQDIFTQNRWIKLFFPTAEHKLISSTIAYIHYAYIYCYT